MQFPFDDLALENQLLTLQNVMLRSGGKPRHIMLLEEQSVQDFGLTLFNTLFTGAIGNCYAVSRREAELQGKGFRCHTDGMAGACWFSIRWVGFASCSRAD